MDNFVIAQENFLWQDVRAHVGAEWQQASVGAASFLCPMSLLIHWFFDVTPEKEAMTYLGRHITTYIHPFNCLIVIEIISQGRGKY